MKNLTALILVSALALTAPLLAKVTEGPLRGSLNFDVFAGIGDASDEYSFEELDKEGENYFQDTILLENESDRGEINAELEVDIGYTGQFIRQSNELTDLDYVTIKGSQYTTVEFSGSGNYLDNSGISATFSSIGPGNELLQEFTVTDAGPELASITVALRSASENGNLSKLRLQRFENGNWTNIATYLSTGYYSYHKENRSLDPGLYRINGYNPTAEATGVDESSFTIDEGIFYEITFGTPPLPLPFPEEGDFSYPGVGTEFTNPSNLLILTPSIVSEVALENDMTELTFAANLVNTSPCPWFLVRIRLSDAANEASGIIATNDGVIFPDIDAFSTTPPIHNAVIQVPNDILDTVKASILDASGLTVEGMELIVFRYPVTFAWPELTDYKVDQGTNLEFWATSYGPDGP